MLKAQKEQLSSLMDGSQSDVQFIDTITSDDELKQSWYRYHVARDVMQGKLYGSVLTWNIADKVANAIALDELFDQASTNWTISPKLENVFWSKLKEGIGKLGQVGLAACITLGIIAGVQYQQGVSNNDALPVLNTVPVGVSVSPVGGIATGQNQYQAQQDAVDAKEYNKIRFLIQDYELQKRLNMQQ